MLVQYRTKVMFVKAKEYIIYLKIMHLRTGVVGLYFYGAIFQIKICQNVGEPKILACHGS